MEIAKLQQNVKGAFVWLGLLTLAFGGALWFLIARVDTGFDKLNGDVGSLQAAIASQTATLGSIDARMARSEDRLDQRNDDSQEGATER